MLSEKYLVNPFIKSITSPEISTSELKIIQGATGLGKSYTTLNSFVPYMFDQMGIKLVVLTIPQLNVLNLKDVYAAQQKNFPDALVVVGSENPKAVYQVGMAVATGRKVLYVCTNSKFHRHSTNQILEVVTHNKIKCATIHDEVHASTTSGYENYRDVMGHVAYEDSFGATFFKAILRWAKYTPYTYGLTATPNREQLGIVSSNKGLKFSIINGTPTKSEMLPHSAWIDNIMYYGDSVFADYRNHVEAVVTQLDTLVKSNIENQFKNVMMIQCAPNNTKSGLRIEDAVEVAIGTLQEYEETISQKDKVIAVMTSDSMVTGFYTVGGKFTPSDDETILAALRSQEHPACVLIVIGKGQVGMNISTLKTIVVARISDKADTNGESIIEAARQLIGRAVRISPPIELSEFVRKYDYDLTQYVAESETEDHIKLLSTNSINIIAPDTNMWHSALNKFRTDFCTVDEAREWIMDITQSVIETESGKVNESIFIKVAKGINPDEIISVHRFEPEVNENEELVVKVLQVM